MPEVDTFDAELVGVLRGDLTAAHGPLMFMKDGEGRPKRLSSTLLQDLGCIQMAETVKEMAQAFVRIRKVGVSRELSDVLLEGRVKVGLLLDSPGGSLVTALRIVEYLKSVQDSGEVHTFAGQDASSAAFSLWEQGAPRVMLKETTALLHTSASRGKRLPELEEIEVGEMRDLLSSAQEPYRSEWLAALDRNVKGRHEVAMRGFQLEEAGLATRAYHGSPGQKALFDDQFPWALRGDTAIRRYWKGQAAQQAEGRSSDWIILRAIFED